MPATIITTEDLYDFKIELYAEIRKMLHKKYFQNTKTWLKSSEVMEILKISAGTLQGLRESGDLPYSKMGKSYYYDLNEINRVLDEKSSNRE